jgi:hypothetical protein
MLERMGTLSVRLTSGVPTGDEVPRRLLVTSGQRALDFDQRVVDKGDHVVTVAMLSNPSKSLVRQVAIMGFDYVVERPVDSGALKHLLQAALYRGDERRCEPRFAAGYAIRFRAGWRRREAMLAELSRWGCSMRVLDCPWLKRDLKVYLPAEFTGNGPLALRASVVRSERCGRETLVSMAFHRDARTRARVSALLPQLRHGPMTLPS